MSIQPNPALSVIMTRDVRTMHRINSEVGKFALGTVNVRGRRPGSTGGYPILWKSEIQKTLGALNVCVHHSGVLRFLNYFRAVWSWTMPLRPTKPNDTRRSPST